MIGELTKELLEAAPQAAEDRMISARNNLVQYLFDLVGEWVQITGRSHVSHGMGRFSVSNSNFERQGGGEFSCTALVLTAPGIDRIDWHRERCADIWIWDPLDCENTYGLCIQEISKLEPVEISSEEIKELIRKSRLSHARQLTGDL